MNLKLLVALSALLCCMHGTSSAQTPPVLATKSVVLAGGCFWCMQEPFDHVPGVVNTVVGYTGGSAEDANYEKVSAHKTEHREAIEITYDPAKVTFEQLIDIFFHNINPTQADGQFHDHGLSYQTAIYFGDGEEKRLAEAAKERLAKSGKFNQPIATAILAGAKFYPAEEYHQKYYLKSPAAYEAYHVGSGRVSYLEKLWGK